jgi:hypothetical protein
MTYDNPRLIGEFSPVEAAPAEQANIWFCSWGIFSGLATQKGGR